MKPTWFIHHRQDDFDVEMQRLVYIPQEMGMQVVAGKEVPFGGTNFSILPQERIPVIFHGGIGLLRQAQKVKQPWIPYIWCDWDLLACRSYYAHWGAYLLQREYAFYPFGELLRLKDKLYRAFGYAQRDDKQIFIRPDSNDKIFNGELIAEGRFDYWHRHAAWNQPPADTLCVVCRPEQIKKEYRLIIKNKKVIAGSQYRSQGYIDIDAAYPDSAIVFAEGMAQIWTPHPIFCLDVALTANDEWVVIECGSVNCAGFYAADLRAIVAGMAEVAEIDWAESYEPLIDLLQQHQQQHQQWLKDNNYKG
jgi:hypothetical protein